MSHRPDFLFGCLGTWGLPLNSRVPLLADMLQHQCNFPGRHEGPHQCKCGNVCPWEDAA